MKRLILFTTILLPLSAAGQVLEAGDFSQFKERLQFITDRNRYLAGEVVLFQQLGARKEKKSSIVYYDLYRRADGVIIQRAKVAPAARGYFRLPDTLSTGTYVIRGYARNGLAQQEEKRILVINTHDPVPHSTKDAAISAVADKGDDGFFVSASQDSVTTRTAFSITIKCKAATGARISAGLSVHRVDAVQGSGPLTSEPVTVQASVVDSNGIAEVNGQVIKGTITSKTTGKAIDVPVFLSIMSKVKPCFMAQQSQDGNFLFELPAYQDSATLVLTGVSRDYQIAVEHFQPASYPAGAGEETAAIGGVALTDLQKDHAALQIQKAYYFDETGQAVRQRTDSVEFFGKPDEDVLLDNYTRFVTMEEVFREFIKTVMVRKRGDTLYLHVLDNFEINPKFMDDAPLVLLDGVPVVDNKQLFDIDPIRIRKIAVLARRYYLGPAEYAGVVSLQTYRGDHAATALSESALVLDWNGTLPAFDPLMPVYKDQPITHLPDQRLLLYWNPDIQLEAGKNQTFTFYTGDIKGKFCAEVSGVDANGKVYDYQKIFLVF